MLNTQWLAALGVRPSLPMGAASTRCQASTAQRKTPCCLGQPDNHATCAPGHVTMRRGPLTKPQFTPNKPNRGRLRRTSSTFLSLAKRSHMHTKSTKQWAAASACVPKVPLFGEGAGSAQDTDNELRAQGCLGISNLADLPRGGCHANPAFVNAKRHWAPRKTC